MVDIQKKRVRWWAWVAAIWMALGVFDATQTVFTMRAQGMHHSWVQLFIALSLTWVPWMLATPVAIYLGHRYRPVSIKPLSTWVIHVSAVIVIAIVVAAWGAALDRWLHPWAPDEIQLSYLREWLTRLGTGLATAMVLYAFILTAGYLLDSRSRLANQAIDAARLNEQLSNAKLSALRQQIEPHFIFNALNAATGLVREGRNDAAVSMLVGLSDFLRRVATDHGDAQVALAQELEFLEKYLDIQKVRFADRLTVTMHVPAELLQAEIPSLLLQPLVENAIKHGIAKTVKGGVIRIAATNSGGKLRLRIYNDGPCLEAGWDAERGGIGLANLRTRLGLLYGTEFELRLANHDAGGVQASVTLPYRKAS
jgi:two-component system, LytTR family, sensor kinase